MTTEEIITKEPVEETKEPEPTPEEVLEGNITKHSDAEQVRVHALNECGTPMKYMVIRSALETKEVLHIPQYYALKEKDSNEIIGYQRWGEDVTIRDLDTKQAISLNVIGERERGE